jgi:drug/metabolite transporter (DMT)-like permease
MSQPSPFKAASLAVFAMACLSFNDAIMKHMGLDFPVGQRMFVRGIFAIGFLLLVFKLFTSLPRADDFKSTPSLLRGIFEVLATFCFLSALSLLPFAVAVTLAFSAPTLTTVLAATILKEKVGIWRWSAVLIGFAGVYVMSQPSADSTVIGVVLAMLASVFIASRDLSQRFIRKSIPVEAIAIMTAVVVTIAGALSWFWEDWQPTTMVMVSWMAINAVFMCSSYYFYTKAISLAELSFVSPFAYVSILVSALLGYLVWNEVPGQVVFIGAGLIILSGLVILWREKVVQDRRAKV